MELMDVLNADGKKQFYSTCEDIFKDMVGKISQPEYMNQKELCKYLDVSDRYARDNDVYNSIPYRRLPGGMKRYSRREVDEWWQSLPDE